MLHQLFYALLILIPLAATHAKMNLPPPEELKKRAEESREKLIEVLLDIDQNLQEMTDPEIFESYFGLLEDLRDLSERANLNEIYPQGVEGLGRRMAAYGARWLRPNKDSADKLIDYHRWMDAQTAAQFQYYIELAIMEYKESEVLKRLALNIEALGVFAKTHFSQELLLRNGYKRLLSKVATKYLTLFEVGDDEIDFWMSKISSAENLAEILNQIYNRAIQLKKDSQPSALDMMRRLLIVERQVSQLRDELPAYLVTFPAEIMLVFFNQILALEITSPEELTQQALAILPPQQMRNLSQQIRFNGKPPSDTYAEEYQKLLEQIYAALKAADLDQEAAEFRRFIDKASATIVGKKIRMEGTYDLVDRRGKKWRFTVVQSKADTYYAALVDTKGFVYKYFTSISYDAVQEVFVASKRDVDTDPEQNLTLIFSLKNDVMNVIDPFGDPSRQPLLGKKVQEYPNYLSGELSDDLRDVTGRYRGRVPFPGGLEKEMLLIVTGFSNYTLGRLTDEEHIRLELNVGTRGLDGILYLTTGRLRKTSWVQMRGTLENNEYRGFIIVGGHGIAPRPFVLRKVKN